MNELTDTAIGTVIALVVVTTVLVGLVRQSRDEYKIYWMIAGAIGSTALLGFVRGMICITAVIATGRASNVIDSRKLSTRVADMLGIELNLFMTSLEQSLPQYTEVLAHMHREQRDLAEDCDALLPYVASGLDILEGRFGPQPQIDDARARIRPRLDALAARLESAAG